MTSHMRAPAWVAIIALALAPLSVGCRTMHPVAVQTTASQPPQWTVAPGDDLRLTMNDGRRVRIAVRAVAADGLVDADGRRFAFAEIRAVERREFSGGRTTLLLAGGALAAVFLYMLAWVSAMGSAWASG